MPEHDDYGTPWTFRRRGCDEIEISCADGAVILVDGWREHGSLSREALARRAKLVRSSPELLAAASLVLHVLSGPQEMRDEFLGPAVQELARIVEEIRGAQDADNCARNEAAS